MIHGGDCSSVYKTIFITLYKDEVKLHQKVIVYLLTFYLTLVLLFCFRFGLAKSS